MPALRGFSLRHPSHLIRTPRLSPASPSSPGTASTRCGQLAKVRPTPPPNFKLGRARRIRRPNLSPSCRTGPKLGQASLGLGHTSRALSGTRPTAGRLSFEFVGPASKWFGTTRIRSHRPRFPSGPPRSHEARAAANPAPACAERAHPEVCRTSPSAEPDPTSTGSALNCVGRKSWLRICGPRSPAGVDLRSAVSDLLRASTVPVRYQGSAGAVPV